MNRHEFQQVARQFRAGRISLNELTDRVLPEQDPTKPAGNSEPAGLPQMPARRKESHKHDYGRVVVVAGSSGMAGAATLTGLAALRSGAGIVTVATARSCQQVIAGFHPVLMTVSLPNNDDGKIDITSWAGLHELIGDVECLAFGPGLGRSSQLEQLAREVFRKATCPVVMDADGLNNLGADFDWPSGDYPRILTPHPGELRRLVRTVQGTRKDLEYAASELASRTGCIVLLKGNRTLVTDGRRLRHNTTGNPGMATAGSGDVLTGVIAALIGQGLEAWDAAVLGCHVHGAAGDLAASRKGPLGMIATDMIDSLPETLKTYCG